MPNHRPDPERLTSLLRQCLSRIDAQARRVHRSKGRISESMAHLFDDQDTKLQGVLESLLAWSEPEDHADLNRVVRQTVQSFLGATNVPVVVREKLAPDLPSIACGPVPLTCAVRRALVLALGRTEGGEITVTTRAVADSVVFEVERHSMTCEHHMKERGLTLCEFVARMRGECRIDYDQRGALLISIDLPPVLRVDEY